MDKIESSNKSHQSKLKQDVYGSSSPFQQPHPLAFLQIPQPLKHTMSAPIIMQSPISAASSTTDIQMPVLAGAFNSSTLSSPNIPQFSMRRGSIGVSSFVPIVPSPPPNRKHAISAIQELRPFRSVPALHPNVSPHHTYGSNENIFGFDASQSYMRQGSHPISNMNDIIEEKKHQRLQKNREAAKESRRKKKTYILELEDSVRTLKSENSDLKHQLEACHLKISQLETMLKSHQDEKVTEDNDQSKHGETDEDDLIARYIKTNSD